MGLIKDLLSTSHGYVIIAIVVISAFAVIYVQLNWNRGANHIQQSIGWYIFALYCVTAIFLPSINLKVNQELSTALLSLLLCVAFGALVQSIMLIRHVHMNGYPLPSGEKHYPAGSNGQPLTLKDSLALLSKITGKPRFLMPDDARQICETCFYYPSAISIAGNIIRLLQTTQVQNKWSLVNIMLIDPERKKRYSACSEENSKTFTAIEIATTYYLRWDFRSLIHNLVNYSVDDKLIPSELAKTKDLSIEDIESFLTSYESYSLLRYEEGFYYLTPTFRDYIHFHKDDFTE